MEATEQFADVVARDPVRLDEAALLIGAHVDPHLDVADGLSHLDDLAASVPDATVESLLATLFGTEGFIGEREHYYDPRNSYLHEVLERRRGIPITLSLLAIEVGRRLDIALDGIGTPAHFLLGTREATPRFVDAFGGGRILGRDDLDRFFAELVPGVEIDPFLVPLGSLDVLRRILANLTAIHRRSGDREALLWTTQLRTVIPGSTADDERIFGGALAASGDFVRAAKVLESIVDGGRASDPERELAEAQRLRARLN